MSFCGGSSMAYISLQSHFRVQANNYVEVVLRCVVVGVVTIIENRSRNSTVKKYIELHKLLINSVSVSTYYTSQ